MSFNNISELRSELNSMVESHFDNGSLSDPEFVNTILTYEKRLTQMELGCTH